MAAVFLGKPSVNNMLPPQFKSNDRSAVVSVVRGLIGANLFVSTLKCINCMLVKLSAPNWPLHIGKCLTVSLPQTSCPQATRTICRKQRRGTNAIASQQKLFTR